VRAGLGLAIDVGLFPPIIGLCTMPALLIRETDTVPVTYRLKGVTVGSRRA